MNSSRGIPEVQSPSGTPLPTFILVWKILLIRAREGREQSGRHSRPRPAHSTGITHGGCPLCHGEPVAPSTGTIPVLLTELLLVISAYFKCLPSVFPMLPVGTGMFSTPRAGFHALRALPASVLGLAGAEQCNPSPFGLGEPKSVLAVLQPVVFISTEGK